MKGREMERTALQTRAANQDGARKSFELRLAGFATRSASKRPIVNFSGGERFQVSLALAFGLSELNAGTLNAETFFQDEGFGTLDEKTLDISIATLEGMQRDGSKMIGVISHVRELEARLPTKITIVKKGHGVNVLEGPGINAAEAAALTRRARRES